MNLCCGVNSKETGHWSLPNGDVVRVDFDSVARRLDCFVATYFTACRCGLLHQTNQVFGDHASCITAAGEWMKGEAA